MAKAHWKSTHFHTNHWYNTHWVGVDSPVAAPAMGQLCFDFVSSGKAFGISSTTSTAGVEFSDVTFTPPIGISVDSGCGCG